MVVHAPFFPTKVAFRTALSLLAGWQTGEIHIQDQDALWRVLVANGLPGA